MKQKNNLEKNQTQSQIEDMALNQEQASEVKGGDGAILRSFYAYEGFSGGVSVGRQSDGRDDIIVGAAINGHVK